MLLSLSATSQDTLAHSKKIAASHAASQLQHWHRHGRTGASTLFLPLHFSMLSWCLLAPCPYSCPWKYQIVFDASLRQVWASLLKIFTRQWHKLELDVPIDRQGFQQNRGVNSQIGNFDCAKVLVSPGDPDTFFGIGHLCRSSLPIVSCHSGSY